MSKPRQQHFTPAELEALRRQDWVCKACGADLTKITWHFDHIVPRARRGVDARRNFHILCAACNVDKSDQLHEEWAPELVQAGVLAGLPPHKTQFQGGRRLTYIAPARGTPPQARPLVEERTSPLSKSARQKIKRRRRAFLLGKAT